MDLYRHGREFYKLRITAETSAGDPVELDAWEASFDGGENWHTAEIVTWDGTDWSGWLLAGPEADATGAVAVIDRSLQPQVRLIDNPEIVVRSSEHRVSLKSSHA